MKTHQIPPKGVQKIKAKCNFWFHPLLSPELFKISAVGILHKNQNNRANNMQRIYQKHATQKQFSRIDIEHFILVTFS